VTLQPKDISEDEHKDSETIRQERNTSREEKSLFCLVPKAK